MASKQIAANLTPLQVSQIRPDLVLIGITHTMQNEGDHLIREIKDTGISAQKITLDNESSLQQLQQQFEQIVEQYFEKADLLINLTGGTKIMALAAYQVFASYGFRCFYQDHQSNEIVWLDDESRISEHQNKMGLVRYLKAYQFNVAKKQKLEEISQEHRTYVSLIIDYLNKNFDKNVALVSKLNAFASQKPLSSSYLDTIKFTPEEDAFIRHLLHETQLFKWQGKKLVFTCKEDQQLVSGAWFEIYTADMLKKVKNIRELSLSVEISKSTQRLTAKTCQEMDVMAMYLEKLVLVECKTVNWENKTATEASGAIYKLSALSNIGGLNTLACFVSLYDLPDAAKTRVAENNIQVICAKNILQMTQHFKKWLEA